MKNQIPILLSEKAILAVQSYKLKKDPFIGIVEGSLKQGIDLKKLNKVYQSVLKSHTSFSILFKKQEKTSFFEKEIQKLSSPEMKIFKSKKSFLLWKEAGLPAERLYDMSLYQSYFCKVLAFKFHHLILDARSLFYFFEEVSKKYFSDSLNNGSLNDFEVYKKVMNDFSIKEKEDQEKKLDFWKKKMKGFKDNAFDSRLAFVDQKKKADLQESTTQKSVSPKNKANLKDLSSFQRQTLPISKEGGSFCVSIGRLKIRKLIQAQNQLYIKIPYLLFAFYSKALQKTFQSDSLVLKIPFSARGDLKDINEKRLIASLSRSVPLFIPSSQLSIKDLALDLKEQSRQARENLIMERWAFPAENLKSWSKRKKEFFSFSMSYFFYKEKDFLGSLKNFYWQESFLDLVLFIILSEKTFLLSFSYNPQKFSKADIKLLSKNFKKIIGTKIT